MQYTSSARSKKSAQPTLWAQALPSRPTLLSLALTSALALGTLSAPVAAQTPNASVATVPVRIAAQPLVQALGNFVQQTQHQVLFDETLVSGRQAAAVAGDLSPRAALEQLLRGSGLAIATERAGAFTLRALPTAPSASTSGASSTLPSVTVTAQTVSSAITEQTGGYSTPAVNISKVAGSIRETPQSISVITRQQMDDRNLTTLEEVMAQATGTTKSQRNFGDHKFAIRGFPVDNDNYLVDGISGLLYSSTGWLPVDMAIYDRVEIIRGAGGMVVGSADPSGAINMVRKRPRDEAHVDVTARVGSWNNRRVEIDAGGPLNADRTVRGRFVAAFEDRDFFYNAGGAKEPLLYGVIDADLGRDTTVTAGLRHQKNTTNGFWLFGLPRFSDGGALDIPRSTAFVQNWNRQDATTNEFFAEAEHRFAGDWKARLTMNHTEGELNQIAAVPRGAVDRATGLGSRFYTQYFKQLNVVSNGADANVGGSFNAWGQKHQMLVGANWSRQRIDDYTAQTGSPVPIDIYNPNYSSIPRPTRPAWDSNRDITDERFGLYGSVRLQLSEPLHVLLGGRVSWLRYESASRLTGNKVSDYKQNSEFTPYAGVVYDLSRHWSVYASYTDTFQPQSAYYSASGNPLKPTVGSNMEAGIKGEFYDGRLNMSAAVFSMKKDNVAVVDPNNLGQCPYSPTTNDCYINGSTLRSKGFEAEVSGELQRGWQVAAGYTYVTSRRDDGSSISAETPRNLLRLSTSYRLPGEYNAWTIGGGVSAQTSYSFQADDNPAVRMSEGGRAIWDVRAAYRINRNWTASLNIANLFDKHYYAMLGQLQRGNWIGEPRNAMLTLRGNF